jgi:DNA-binding IclR family transcriptional regulator
MSSVQSVERAFAILRALSSGPAGVTDVAQRTRLPKSTVSRLLGTLEELGMVEQVVAGGDYRIGGGLIEIAGSTQPGRSLVAAARPHLLELIETTGESAGLSVADGEQVHFLDQVDSDHQVLGRDWTGDRLPMHSTSSGLVLLAFGAESLRSSVMRKPLLASARHTITDAQALGRRLAEIRMLGYAWAFEEFSDGLNSVAAPIFGSDGSVVGALHAHGPAYRFPGNRSDEEIGELVSAAALRIQFTLT